MLQDMELLDETAVAAGIAGLRWDRDGDSLATTRVFAGFPAAIEFVDRVAELAERLGHHPDIAVAYNRVTLRSTTHDAGGLTAADLVLAAAVDALPDPGSPVPTSTSTSTSTSDSGG